MKNKNYCVGGNMTIIILNGIFIIIGTLIGVFFGKALSKNMTESIIKILGIFVFIMGLKDALTYKNGMYIACYLVVGTIIGEKLDLDGKLKKLGEILQSKVKVKSEKNTIQGFVTAVLIFCVGSMAILGPIKISLNNDGGIIYIKSILDGVMSIMLASTYGIGVIFSSAVVVIYQGMMFFMGSFLKLITEASVMGDITSIGGVILAGLGLNLLFSEEKLKITNILPAMFLPLITAFFTKII